MESQPIPLDEEELKDFLTKYKGVKLWKDEEIQHYMRLAEGLGGEEDGFKKDYEDKETGTLIEQRPGKNGAIEVRVTLTIKNGNPKQFYDYVMDFDYKETYDKMMNKYEVLKRLTEYQWLVVYETKPLFFGLVSGRDFVYVSYRREVKPGHFLIFSRSCDYESAYPVPKDVVRGLMHNAIFYTKPHPKNEKDMLLSYMANAESKGSIPKWLTNWLTRKFAPSYTSKLRKQYSEFPEYLRLKKKKERRNSEEEEEDGED